MRWNNCGCRQSGCCSSCQDATSKDERARERETSKRVKRYPQQTQRKILLLCLFVSAVVCRKSLTTERLVRVAIAFWLLCPFARAVRGRRKTIRLRLLGWLASVLGKTNADCVRIKKLQFFYYLKRLFIQHIVSNFNLSRKINRLVV